MGNGLSVASNKLEIAYNWRRKDHKKDSSQETETETFKEGSSTKRIFNLLCTVFLSFCYFACELNWLLEYCDIVNVTSMNPEIHPI